MNRQNSVMDQVNIIAQLSDIKNDLYQTTLLLTALLEVLLDNQVIKNSDINHKMSQLEMQLDISLQNLEQLNHCITIKQP